MHMPSMARRLCRAVQKGWLKVVNSWLKVADLDAKDARGRTALDYAKGNGGAGGHDQARATRKRPLFSNA